MQGVIIADTSCLILLSKINELDVLRLLYGKIFITSVIASEFGIPVPDWIIVKNANKHSVVNLDPGEASAIDLALENSGCLLIIDDLQARRVAQHLKLIFTGTLGVLLEAKRRGHVHSIKDIIAKIRSTNFHLTKEIEQRALKLAGEI